MTRTNASRGLVLALGGGGARGIAHIGVLEVLERERIPVRAVVGTSIGAEIGAFLATGTPVIQMEKLASGMDWISTMRLFTPDFGEAGLSTGKGITEYLSPWLAGKRIEDLPLGFAAVAADLNTGEEVVIQSGELLDAVRASISLPGLLTPVCKNGHVLIDGGVVNPVPFDVARSLFGGPVLAVQAHPSVRQHVQHREEELPEWERRLNELLTHPVLDKAPPQIRAWFEGLMRARRENGANNGGRKRELGISSILNQTQLITADMLMKLRMRLSPPDLLLKPDIHDIGMLEFYRAQDAIAAGRRAAESHLADIRRLYS